MNDKIFGFSICLLTRCLWFLRIFSSAKNPGISGKFWWTAIFRLEDAWAVWPYRLDPDRPQPGPRHHHVKPRGFDPLQLLNKIDGITTTCISFSPTKRRRIVTLKKISASFPTPEEKKKYIYLFFWVLAIVFPLVNSRCS